MNADDPSTLTPSDTPNSELPDDDVREARARVFASLPPEIQANPQVRRTFGLGDLVAVVAKPVARALGRKADCAPCKKRQEALNRITLWKRARPGNTG